MSRVRTGRRRGAIVVIVALVMVLLMLTLALVVDIGSRRLAQAELQAAADAAALAAAGEMSKAEAGTSAAVAQQAAALYGTRHGSLGHSSASGGLSIAPADVELGDGVFEGSGQSWTFTEDSSAPAPYAVRVTVRRDGVNNPLVPQFFAPLFGQGDATQSATAAAMITPRDIALVIDLSQSMTFDSMFIRRNDTQINLRDVWVTLEDTSGAPSTKVVPGVGEFVTDYDLRTPDNSPFAGQSGRTFGSMSVWGSTIYQGTYNQSAVASDPGMYYLPEQHDAPSGGWFTTLGYPSDARYQWLVEDLTNPHSLASRGHDAGQVGTLLNRPSSGESSSNYRRRVKILLGLENWTDDGDNVIENNEVSQAFNEPYAVGVDWDDWINDVRNASGLTYNTSFGGAGYFRDRYGLKSYVNWLMDRQFAKGGPVPGSSGHTPRLQFSVAEPVQSLKDAVDDFSKFLMSVESNDKVGLVVYGTNGASDPYSATQGLTNDFFQLGLLPFPHQPGEEGRFTNTAEAIIRGYHMIHGPGSRPYAHKVIVFMSDGYTTVNNNFNYISDLEHPGNIEQLKNIKNLTALNAIFGGFPSSSKSTQGGGSSAGRDETIGIARMLASNRLGMGSAEFIVVGVGAQADMDGLLTPVAQANGGQAYYAAPDINNPNVLPQLLRDIYRRIGGRRPVALIHPGN